MKTSNIVNFFLFFIYLSLFKQKHAEQTQTRQSALNKIKQYQSIEFCQ